MKQDEDAITWVAPLRWPRPTEAFFEFDVPPRPLFFIEYALSVLAGCVLLVMCYAWLADRWITWSDWPVVAGFWLLFACGRGVTMYAVWTVAWLIDRVWPPVVTVTARGIAGRTSFTPFADMLSPLTIFCRVDERYLRIGGGGVRMGGGLAIAESVDVEALKALIERGGKRVVIDTQGPPPAGKAGPGLPT